MAKKKNDNLISNIMINIKKVPSEYSKNTETSNLKKIIHIPNIKIKNNKKNSLKILNLNEKNYNKKNLKKNYKININKYHPDKGSNRKDFEKIMNAYTYLLKTLELKNEQKHKKSQKSSRTSKKSNKKKKIRSNKKKKIKIINIYSDKYKKFSIKNFNKLFEKENKKYKNKSRKEKETNSISIEHSNLKERKKNIINNSTFILEENNENLNYSDFEQVFCQKIDLNKNKDFKFLKKIK